MLILAIFWMGLQVQAQAQLTPLPDMPKVIQFKPKPVLSTEVPCSKIVEHIQQWGQFRADADIAVASFGEQLGNTVDSWVKILKPLEKTTVTINEFYFNPVVEGSAALQDNIPLIYENSDYFDSHLKTVILPTIEKCLQEKTQNGSGRNN